MIPTNLIESALHLTGKTMEDMQEEITFRKEMTVGILTLDRKSVFSIEKLCYYLLSYEFIEKYNKEYCDTINCDVYYTAMSF